jgi:hypothetical protein
VERRAEAEASVKDLEQWVCWRSEARERDGKPTKVPYSPREKAGRRGLVISWSGEPAWTSLHDPTAGELHDVKPSECQPAIVGTARAHRRRGRSRGV